MYFVYVLTNPGGKLYIGQTNNVTRRLYEHNHGHTVYTTKMKGPWTLIYQESNFENRAAVMRREKELKTGKGREFLKKLRM